MLNTSSDATLLLRTLEGQGITLTLEEGRIRIELASKLTPDLLDALKAQKEAVKALLADPLPEPITPSPIWADAIAQAQQLDQAQRYVLRLCWPTDDRQAVARLVDPGGLPQALQAMQTRYPQTEAVVILKPITRTEGGREVADLETVMVVGTIDG